MITQLLNFILMTKNKWNKSYIELALRNSQILALKLYDSCPCYDATFEWQFATKILDSAVSHQTGYNLLAKPLETVGEV